jgi:uncharacterized protein with PQ loop repeat
MHLPSIGQLSLSLSFFVYCLYFLPQIWHNRKPSHARYISRFLQLIYVLGYSADWLYGAAAHLEWQYRCVSLIGIFALSYQQWQMRPPSGGERSYGLHSFAVASMILTSFVFSLFFTIKGTLATNAFGTISMLCAMFALTPQLIRNYKDKNGLAISHFFIGMTLIGCILDMISAIFLHWPWQSLVSPPILFIIQLSCWWQQRFYRKKTIGDKTEFYSALPLSTSS